MRRNFSLLTILASLATLQAQECTVGTDGTCLPTPPVLDCGVYMAPSTLGGDTNMGIYTGKALKADEAVNFPEIAIPLLFREWGDHKPGYEDGVLWERYIWEGDIMDIETYEDYNRHKSRAVFVPGVGCTINSILDMNNIESTHGSVYDTTGLHRSKDPGTTAFCPYHSATTTTTQAVEAGSELFAQYGDDWIPDIPGAQISMNEHLDEAEDFLREQYLPWVLGRKLSTKLKQGLWELALNVPTKNPPMTNLPRFPFADVESAAKEHDDSYSLVRHFIRKQSIRSIDWLNEKGYCQDHIRPDKSTIPQAGRGAFATRDLPAGTIVGYAPLIHFGIFGKEVLWDNYPPNFQQQFDLVLNYSFGHKNSTVLLTPYGGMVNYINHSKEKANVKVQWPNKELIAHKPEWLHESPEFLRDTTEKIGLSFEYVALRDIKQGEEVFMDYGNEWQEAWDEYVKDWQPPADAENYIHRSDWKEEHFRTEKELETNPYPSNLITMCFESYSQLDDGTYEWLPALRDMVPFRIYCDVLERHEHDDDDPPTYTVRMHLNDDSIVVENVDKDGIFLYDKAFSQDWHLPNAFRHEIMIPDDVMPQAWLNGPPEQVLGVEEEEEE